MSEIKNTYYTKQTKKLLKQYGKVSKKLLVLLSSKYGNTLAKEIVDKTRIEYESLIPKIPYIGGRSNYFSPIMLINGWIIALYSVLKTKDKPIEDLVYFCKAITDSFFNSIPGFIHQIIKKMAFNRLVILLFQRQANQSQKKRYPADFVYTIKKGTTDCDWGFEFEECAVMKLYDQLGVPELKPYCCFFDLTYSQKWAMGFDGRHTIGLGNKVCKMYYKKNRKTVVPESLKAIFDFVKSQDL